VEILNNTGATINHSATNYVLDDNSGSELSDENITSGSLASGQVGILFNGEEITVAEMQAAWGAGLNYIPVSDWPSLANDGDTIAIWSSLAGYQSEPVDAPNRSHDNAAADVTYDNRAAADYTVWRNNLNATITLSNEEPTTTPGVVTRDDYLVWKYNYGSVGAAAGASHERVVPEPVSACLIGMAEVGAFTPFRPRRALR
jgi:hypothetical protein